MKEFHREDFANRTGLAQAWTVKSADRLFTPMGFLCFQTAISCAYPPVEKAQYFNAGEAEVSATPANKCTVPCLHGAVELLLTGDQHKPCASL